MEFKLLKEEQWAEIKSIYMEAFPKRERKPFFTLKRSVKKKKAVIMTASEENQILGFVVLIPYKDMVMVDYLAVSSRIRSKGTGSYIMQNVCREFSDKKIVLLIERLEDDADNRDQRIARRKFYLKNGFSFFRHFYYWSEWEYGDYELRGKGDTGKIYESSGVCFGKIVF